MLQTLRRFGDIKQTYIDSTRANCKKKTFKTKLKKGD